MDEIAIGGLVCADGLCCIASGDILKLLRSPGIDSAGLSSPGGPVYDNPVPTRFLAIIDCSEVPPLGSTCIELAEFRSVEYKLSEID